MKKEFTPDYESITCLMILGFFPLFYMVMTIKAVKITATFMGVNPWCVVAISLLLAASWFFQPCMNFKNKGL